MRRLSLYLLYLIMSISLAIPVSSWCCLNDDGNTPLPPPIPPEQLAYMNRLQEIWSTQPEVRGMSEEDYDSYLEEVYGGAGSVMRVLGGGMTSQYYQLDRLHASRENAEFMLRQDYPDVYNAISPELRETMADKVEDRMGPSVDSMIGATLITGASYYTALGGAAKAGQLVWQVGRQTLARGAVTGGEIAATEALAAEGTLATGTIETATAQTMSAGARGGVNCLSNGLCRSVITHPYEAADVAVGTAKTIYGVTTGQQQYTIEGGTEILTTGVFSVLEIPGLINKALTGMSHSATSTATRELGAELIESGATQAVDPLMTPVGFWTAGQHYIYQGTLAGVGLAQAGSTKFLAEEAIAGYNYLTDTEPFGSEEETSFEEVSFPTQGGTVVINELGGTSYATPDVPPSPSSIPPNPPTMRLPRQAEQQHEVTTYTQDELEARIDDLEQNEAGGDRLLAEAMAYSENAACQV